MAKTLGVAITEPIPEPTRTEIDLPGQLELEMVGYPILAQSPVRKRESLPSWVRPVFVVRESQVLAPEAAGKFQVGDYAYFLVTPNRVARMDRLFASSDRYASDRAPGVFLFKGDVRLDDLAREYGLSLPDDLRRLTAAEAFAERFENLEVGDTIQLGPAVLVAAETDGDLLMKAALEFDDFELDRDDGASPPTGGGLGNILRLTRHIERGA